MTPDIDSLGDSLIPNESRRIHTEEEFENLYLRHDKSKQISFRQKSSLILRKVFHKIRISYCGPNTNDGFGSQLLRFIYNFFPFIDIIRHYDVKNWLANDLITGFTIGVMHVPQGMAYAMLATVPPIYGLYCSMCASFFYFLLGTSRHLSLSTIAIISLLVGSCLDRTILQLFPGASVNESTLLMTTTPTSDPKETANRVLLASVLAFTVGIIQLTNLANLDSKKESGFSSTSSLEHPALGSSLVFQAEVILFETTCRKPPFEGLFIHNIICISVFECFCFWAWRISLMKFKQ
ncbi:hypothetical protein ACTXT7_011127 [Hymenolepis weldensis]